MADFTPRNTKWVMSLTNTDRQTHPIYGIMGGIWPRANPQFLFPPGAIRPRTKAAVADIVKALGLKEPFVVSPTTGGVCLLQVDDRTDTLCGAVCTASTAMNRHMFQQHTAQIVPYRESRPGPHDREASYESERALWKFVLDGEWRDASFMKEPRKSAEEGPEALIVRIAQHLEHLAETDENFDVAKYGKNFLRQLDYIPQRSVPQPRTGSKRTRRDLQDSDDEQKPPSNKRGRGRAARRGRGTVKRR